MIHIIVSMLENINYQYRQYSGEKEYLFMIKNVFMMTGKRQLMN